MSYRKDYKSRLARFMLALTVMGGVGQRLADNKSSAAWLTKYFGGREQVKRTSVEDIDFVSVGPLLQVVEFDDDLTTKPSKGQDTGTAEARLFEKIMVKGVTRVGAVNEEGKLVQKDNYNNDGVKGLLGPAFKGVFSDIFLASDNGHFSGLSTRDYVFGICGCDPWDVDIVQKFNVARDSVKNSAAGAGKSQFFTTSVQVNDGGAETKIKQMVAIKEDLKAFANGLSGSSILPPQDYNSYIRISKDGKRIKFANGRGGGRGDCYYLYSSARFQKLNSEFDVPGNTLSALVGKLASYEDVAGNYLKVGENYYKLGSGSFDGKISGNKSYRPLAMFQAIHEFKVSGDLESACRKYNEALAVGDRLAGVLAGGVDSARTQLAADFDNFVTQGSIKKEYAKYKKSAVEMVVAFAKICTAEQATDSTPSFDAFVACMSEGTFDGFLTAIQNMYGIGHLGINVVDLKNPGAMDCCFKFLSLKAGFEMPDGDGKKKKKDEKKSSVLKPILWGAGILAILGGSGVALWKTGYGKMLAGKARDFFNKNKNRFASGGNSKPIDTKPVTGKPNPVPKKPN